MTNLYLCKILCNRKSLLSGAVQKEHWPFLGWGVELPTYADLRGLRVSGLLKSAIFVKLSN